jgi:magnesium-transporting ATPase (P-type)
MSPNAAEIPVAIVGLTAQEAAARLDQFGPNEPAATQHHSFLSDLLHVFMNPLTLILVIAAIVSAFTGDKVDAGIIGVIVLLSGAIDLTQTYHSERAVEELRNQVAHHRERNCHRRGRRHGRADGLWRYCGSPRRTPGRDCLR